MMNNFGDLSYLDSNILVYAQQRKSPQHVVAKSLRDQSGPRIMERMLGLLQRYPVQGLRLGDYVE